RTLGRTLTLQLSAPADTPSQTPIAVPPDKSVAGAGDYPSGDFTTSAVGTYRWIAHYTGDANNNAVDTACNDANESSAVNKATPILSTAASGPVIVGGKIHDDAHLSGGFGTLGGTISFQVFAPAGTTCQAPIAVPPDETAAGARAFPTRRSSDPAVGTYRWIAHYTGDANNNAVDTACNDAGESSGVGLETPTLTTTASGPVIVGSTIHDVAHLSGGFGTLGGTRALKGHVGGDGRCRRPSSESPNE